MPITDSSDAANLCKRSTKHSPDTQHIAVFHWPARSYLQRRLRGSPQFVEDSVRKQGFKVISLNHFKWNRMAMDASSRVQVIKKLLGDMGISLDKDSSIKV